MNNNRLQNTTLFKNKNFAMQSQPKSHERMNQKTNWVNVPKKNKKSKKSRIFDPNPNKDCFMGAVPIDSTEDELKSFFNREYPDIEIERVVLVRKKNQKKINKGFGFICLKTKESMEKLLKLKPHFKNKQLDIRRANKYSKQQEMVKEFYSTRVFARCIPDHITDDDLMQTFSKKFEVTRCYIIRDYLSGLSKGLGFIDFSTIEEAKKCLERSIYAIKGIKIPVSPFNIEKKLKKMNLIEREATNPSNKKDTVQNHSSNKSKIPKRRPTEEVIIRRPGFSFSSEEDRNQKFIDRSEFLLASINRRLNEAPMNYQLNKNHFKKKINLNNQRMRY